MEFCYKEIKSQITNDEKTQIKQFINNIDLAMQKLNEKLGGSQTFILQKASVEFFDYILKLVNLFNDEFYKTFTQIISGQKNWELSDTLTRAKDSCVNFKDKLVKANDEVNKGITVKVPNREESK
jgi:hypothetical protein